MAPGEILRTPVGVDPGGLASASVWVHGSRGPPVRRDGREVDMGKLVDGEWHDVWYDTKSTGGRFVRKESGFRNWVTPDGSPGPTGRGGFAAEPGRYHLYVSYACPWAHRALIYRELKGLTDMIGLSVTHWFMGSKGWSFEEGPGVIPDPHTGAKYVHNLYQAADPDYTGRATVPVLWDTKEGTIVSNESAEIIRMFDEAFDGVGAKPGTFRPPELREEIDEINERVYHTVNNGVYKCGFATSQQAYDEAVGPLFETLADLDRRLADRRYLLGDRITEADWRLFTTLARFDLVYHTHFKCNRARIVDHPNLWPYARDLYQQPGVAKTCRFDHAERHYYQSHDTVNPHRIVPIGPDLEWNAPFGRAALAGP
jgi:putative glutathione S-transferase